jgi:hypothetical protein
MSVASNKRKNRLWIKNNFSDKVVSCPFGVGFYDMIFVYKSGSPRNGGPVAFFFYNFLPRFQPGLSSQCQLVNSQENNKRNWLTWAWWVVW